MIWKAIRNILLKSNRGGILQNATDVNEKDKESSFEEGITDLFMTRLVECQWGQSNPEPDSTATPSGRSNTSDVSKSMEQQDGTKVELLASVGFK